MTEEYMENLAGRILRQLSSLRKEVRGIRQAVLEDKKICYTNKEVMDLLGTTSQMLKTWRDSGLLGYSMIGRYYYYTKEDIIKMMASTHFDAFTFDKTDNETSE